MGRDSKIYLWIVITHNCVFSLGIPNISNNYFIFINLNKTETLYHTVSIILYNLINKEEEWEEKFV